MNYRHAYHAGNFADVLKHATLALVIDYLQRKDAPFRVIDTHAGRGRYALASLEADKTGEWRTGIGRLWGADAPPLPDAVARILAPYRKALAGCNPPGKLEAYPGSPLIAQQLMRSQDALVANELQVDERRELEGALGRDRRVKVLGLDGWMALKSLLPPKERRGVILIDPPYEEEGELNRLAQGLHDGLQRFATGVFIAWYPIKDPKPIERLRAAVAANDEHTLLGVELLIHNVADRERLNGCGLVVANPPFTLASELEGILPELTRRMGQDRSSHFSVEQLGKAGQIGPKPLSQAKRRMRTRT
jgi:23S rRNA (adenine2030-N6)-methyltransferase